MRVMLLLVLVQREENVEQSGVCVLTNYESYAASPCACAEGRECWIMKISWIGSMNRIPQKGGSFFCPIQGPNIQQVAHSALGEWRECRRTTVNGQRLYLCDTSIVSMPYPCWGPVLHTGGNRMNSAPRADRCDRPSSDAKSRAGWSVIVLFHPGCL